MSAFVDRVTGPRRGQSSVVAALGRRPALDGLRGLAWILVFVGHAGLSPFPGTARVAMYLFFGLSGFLITSLLVNERATTGHIGLRRFFLRRAFRLLPALFVFLVAWLLVVAASQGAPWLNSVPGASASGSEPFARALLGAGEAFSYFANWLSIFGRFDARLPLGHLWSLSVEEQFYLGWAVLLAILLTRSRRLAGSLAAALALSSLVEVALLLGGHNGDRIYMGTDTRAGAFLLGAVGAVVWSSGALDRLKYRKLGDAVAVIAMIVLCRATVSIAGPSTGAQFFWFWFAASLAGPGLVVAVVMHPLGRIARLFSGSVIGYVGRRSYALYLWHYAWLTWLHNLGIFGVTLALAATFACAELSWRFVEAPMLRLKTRFATEGSVDEAREARPLLEPTAAT